MWTPIVRTPSAAVPAMPTVTDSPKMNTESLGTKCSITNQAAMVIKTAAEMVPTCSAVCGFPSSVVRTRKVPRMLTAIPAAARYSGRVTRSQNGFGSTTSALSASAHPKIMEPMMAPTYDSKRSAPMPATSPTLSPTLSAMVAGFRGSSSGIPASILPTKSAPTSAALVKMPPPTRANRAIEEAPNENPLNTFSATWLSVIAEMPSTVPSKNKYRPPSPTTPSPTTLMPMTDPPVKATLRAVFKLSRAAAAVRKLAAVATRMPKKPASPEHMAPTTKLMEIIQ